MRRQFSSLRRPRQLEELAVRPSRRDNTAIAKMNLPSNTSVLLPNGAANLTHTVLLGHRFCVQNIRPGEPVTSWGYPFGTAMTHIYPGDYLCNQNILTTLEGRGFRKEDLPQAPNFADKDSLTRLSGNFHSIGEQVQLSGEDKFFDGFQRETGRGVGTRNYVIILAVSARVSSLARVVARRLKLHLSAGTFAQIDGVVPVCHTEGENAESFDRTVRVLRNYVVHPNVGAVLLIDSTELPDGYTGEIKNSHILDQVNYTPPLETCSYGSSGFEATVEQAVNVGKSLIYSANKAERVQCSIKGLKVALQCGGSDAFSGVYSNPLFGLTAERLIRDGGSALLAETLELVGAEEYILSNVRDTKTAEKFLWMQQQYKNLLEKNGQSPENNLSGGNLFRGLYNITIKSLGAAVKKSPATRLDGVLQYGERIPDERGYYFMDSPGNDIESIGGQVATGCNFILFSTGNGSMTNFPFVPTLKAISTTNRFNLMRAHMDCDAQAAMEDESESFYRQLISAASGERTRGEHDGQSQVQLWRGQASKFTEGKEALESSSSPPNIKRGTLTLPNIRSDTLSRLRCFKKGDEAGLDRVCLLFPTSLCSSQIAVSMAEKLNEKRNTDVFSRVVATPHTEGCGVGFSKAFGTPTIDKILLGYATNPNVSVVYLLEHGCEMTHNDHFRAVLDANGVSPHAVIGFGSLQKEGGTKNALDSLWNWVNSLSPSRELREVDSTALTVGLLIPFGKFGDSLDEWWELASSLRANGFNVVITSSALSTGFIEKIQAKRLGFAERIPRGRANDLFVMETPGWVGHPFLGSALGATGVSAIIQPEGIAMNPVVPTFSFTEEMVEPKLKRLIASFEERARENSSEFPFFHLNVDFGIAREFGAVSV